MAKYEIIIWRSKKDGCYPAELSELPRCMAHGESLAEVTAAIEESKKMWIEADLFHGKLIHVHILYRKIHKTVDRSKPRKRDSNSRTKRTAYVCIKRLLTPDGDRILVLGKVPGKAEENWPPILF